MDELLGRKTPHSAPAEQAVIGSMLIDPRCIPEVLEKLKADEFYIKLNRDIYETINTMFSYGQTIDPVTVLDQMRSRGVYQEGNEKYMAEVMSVTPTAANVMEYAAIVRDRALLRRLGEAADEINNMVYEGSGQADSVLEAAERRIYALRQGRNVGGLVPVSSVVQNVFDNLSEAAASGSKIPGISTGLPDLDRVTLGLNKSELILIAARPGMGKTSIALNLALHAAMNLKKTVAIFSLEMSREQLVTRLLSRASLVPSQNLLTGQLSEEAGDIRRSPGSQRHRHPHRRQPQLDRVGDERPVPPAAEPGPGSDRLSAIDAVGRQRTQLVQREPHPGRQRHKPYAENNGKGTERAGYLSVSALPCKREPPGQAAHALGPA